MFDVCLLMQPLVENQILAGCSPTGVDFILQV
jgi:sensor histidine kinase YesM